MTAPARKSLLADREESDTRMDALRSALSVLNARERRIFEARRLADDPITLEELSAEFGVSRERVRQIEVRAFEKVQAAVKAGVARAQLPARPGAARFAGRLTQRASRPLLKLDFLRARSDRKERAQPFWGTGCRLGNARACAPSCCAGRPRSRLRPSPPTVPRTTAGAKTVADFIAAYAGRAALPSIKVIAGGVGLSASRSTSAPRRRA